MKKIIFLLCIMLLLVACTNEENGGVELTPNLELEWSGEEPQEETPEMDYHLFTEALQLSPIKQGEELLIMHTTLGDITLRFFPTEAPVAVENFITHARNGYYDNVIFHRVIEDFMIQGGDPLGTGTGGESIWGGTFGQEMSLNLAHLRGALAMAQSSLPNSIGSQFYIVQNSNLHAQYIEYFNFLIENQDEIIATTESGKNIYLRDIHPTEILSYYIENGGTPHLDMALSEVAGGGHTVFGHVVDGMDVVDAIAAVEVKDTRPVEDVIILGFTFFNYGE